MSRGGEGALGGPLEADCGPHQNAVLQPADRTLYRVPPVDPRRPIISLRRFLPLAPACWPRGKIPPHPSARSVRHWSPQNGGPKREMIEGRSGGSGAGAPKRNVGPPRQRVFKQRIARFYHVPRAHPDPFLRPPPDRP